MYTVYNDCRVCGVQSQMGPLVPQLLGEGHEPFALARLPVQMTSLALWLEEHRATYLSS